MFTKTSHVACTLLLAIAVTSCSGLKPKPKFTGEPVSNDHKQSTRITPTLRAKLTQAMESYLGVPYRWGGTTRAGMDCSGFVRTVYRDALGIALPRKARDMFNRGQFVEQSELEFGDLLFFEKVENSGVSHVGVYIGDGEFFHASTSKGVMISSLSESYYRERFVGIRRIVQRSN